MDTAPALELSAHTTALDERRSRAEREAWLGEIEGIDLTLSHLRGKREQTRRLTQASGPIELGMPTARGGDG